MSTDQGSENAFTYSILMVDDDPRQHEWLPEFFALENVPINVDFASTFSVAVNKIKNNRYDLMFVDNYIVEGTGIELVRLLRQGKIVEDEKIRSTPAILVTATLFLDDIDTIMDGYIRKPYEIDEMLSTIKKFLGIHFDL